MRPSRRIAAALSTFLLLSLVAAEAQERLTPQPVPGANTRQPAQAATPPTAVGGSDAAPTDSSRKPIEFRVIELTGDVRWSPIDATEWRPLKQGDAIPEQSKVLTGLRSNVKFQIGEEEPLSLLLVDSVGLTYLAEATVTSEEKRVRVGVGFGRVRAGVSEGGLRSEFTVDSPVATLSKKGTWGFELFYERDTDRFHIGLAERGAITALNRINAQRRDLAPGQHVTQAMRLWLDEAQLRRNVAISDLFGQQDVSVAFNRIRNDGLGIVNPGGGSDVLINLSNRTAANLFANTLRNQVPNIGTLNLQPNNLRPEGFFGSGRGDQLIHVVIDANNSLAQKGLARQGRYAFRRSAVEGWYRANGGGK